MIDLFFVLKVCAFRVFHVVLFFPLVFVLVSVTIAEELFVRPLYPDAGWSIQRCLDRLTHWVESFWHWPNPVPPDQDHSGEGC